MTTGGEQALDLLVTVTFNDNQLRAHIEPLIQLPNVRSVTVVSDRAGATLPKVTFITPPRLLQKTIGRACKTRGVPAARPRRRLRLGIRLPPTTARPQRGRGFPPHRRPRRLPHDRRSGGMARRGLESNEPGPRPHPVPNPAARAAPTSSHPQLPSSRRAWTERRRIAPWRRNRRRPNLGHITLGRYSALHADQFSQNCIRRRHRLRPRAGQAGGPFHSGHRAASTATSRFSRCDRGSRTTRSLGTTARRTTWVQRRHRLYRLPNGHRSPPPGCTDVCSHITV